MITHSESISLLDGLISLSSVDRYHGHPTIKIQSVADHSARVAMIAFELAKEFYSEDLNKAYEVVTIALFHDFSEGILKNDVNSSIKNKYGIRELLKQLEADVVSELFISESSKCYKDLFLENCSEDQYYLMKLADSLDFGMYVWSEVMLGNQHLKQLLCSFNSEVGRYPEKFTSLPFCKLISERIDNLLKSYV